MPVLTKKQLNNLANKYHIDAMYLFGSQAKGKTTKLSDYDFAVLLNKKVKPELYSSCQVDIISALLKMVKANHIDLVVLNNQKAPLLLKYNIIKDGKLLVDKNKDARVVAEVNILRRWLDWEYFERMWGDIYTKQVAEGKI